MIQMRLPSRDRPEAEALRYQLAALAFETRLIPVQQSLDRKYDADQPRAPAGQSDGGQWIRIGSSSNDWSIEESSVGSDGTAIRSIYDHGDRSKGWDERHIVVASDGTSTIFETTGAVQTVRDGVSGEVIARTRMTADGLEEEAVSQPAFLRRLPLLLPGIVPGITPGPPSPFDQATKLYDYLSSRNTADRKAVFGFTARDYDATVPAESRATPGFWVGTLTRDEVNEACPRHQEVQDRTDLAADTITMLGNYKTPSEYGTRVHTELARGINKLENPQFIAERSFLKSGGKAYYSQYDSVRVDVYEEVKVKTVCTYDIKTGKLPLSAARSVEIAATVKKNFPLAERILVTETRPYAQP